MDSLHVALSPESVPQQNNRRYRVGTDLLTLCVALLLALSTRFALLQTPATAATMPYVGVWSHLFLLIFVAGMIGLLVSTLSPRLRTNGMLLWLGLFFFTLLALRLKDTPFTVGGINGDARFYTTYVTKLAAYPGYGDMFYKDLSAFYPPLYYFLVGRVADWLALEPFRVMKAGLLTTVIILPLVTGWLWRRLVQEEIVAAVALCMLVFPDWFKPNEWLALALFVPWWLHWVDNITDYQAPTRGAQLRWWLGGAIIGAVLFQLYFFWLFVGIFTLIARIGWWLCCQRHNRRLRLQLRNGLLMLAFTALLSSPYWAPYLFSMMTTVDAQPLQNRFFGASKIPLPLYFFQDNWQGLFYLGGLLYILFAAASDRVAAGLRWLVCGFVLWVAIGYIAILIDMPLLTFRSYPVFAYLLGAGAFLGLFRLWQNSDQLTRYWPALPGRLVATTLLTLAILLFSNGVVQALLTEENVQDAVDARYPAEELTAFDQLTGEAYEDRVVFVTDRYRSILFFRPVYSFVAWSAHFSHPAGTFHRRIDFLNKAAALHDPQLFAQVMAYNRYDQIDYWLLAEEAEFWHFSFVDDNFPNRVIDRDLYFPKALLQEPYFQREQVDGYTMLKPGDVPISPVTLSTENGDNLTSLSLDTVARLYVLATAFADDVLLVDAATVRQESKQVLQAAALSQLPTVLLLDLQRSADSALAEPVTAALAERLHLSEPITLLDDNGVPTIQLLGYAWQQNATVDAGSLTLYWQLLAPSDLPYTIWLHAFATNDQGDADKFTFDHAPPLAIEKWVPGRIYADQVSLPLEGGTYRLETGFWNEESDQRLKQPTGEWGITLPLLSLP